jgi:hypothetical protein
MSMIYFWVFIVSILGSSSYLFQLSYMKNLHEGKSLVNPRLLGVISVFLAIIIFVVFIVMEV